jgi:hypothetical protein
MLETTWVPSTASMQVAVRVDPARVAPEQVCEKLFEVPAPLVTLSQTQVDQMTGARLTGEGCRTGWRPACAWPDARSGAS